jgi:hypothetical protein
MNRGAGVECVEAWHAQCYQQHLKDDFPVLVATDLEEALVNDEAMEDEASMRFREARDGDHLMCPFQCDDCQFWNRFKRDPIKENVFDTLSDRIVSNIESWMAGSVTHPMGLESNNQPLYRVLDSMRFGIGISSTTADDSNRVINLTY